jgi:hypothetical protein
MKTSNLFHPFVNHVEEALKMGVVEMASVLTLNYISYILE